MKRTTDMTAPRQWGNSVRSRFRAVCLYLIIYIGKVGGVAAVLFGCAAVDAEAGVIGVRNQKDFDGLVKRIADACKGGETMIEVSFEPGTYYFKDGHVALRNRDYASTSLVFRGNGATIVGAGRDYRRGDTYADNFSVRYGYVNLHKGDVAMWGRLVEADDLVEILNKETKACRLPYGDIADIEAAACRNIHINLTQWFQSSYYKVERVKDGYIYFTANDLTYNKSREQYSVNLDMGFGKVVPRFRLCNAPMGEPHLMSLEGNKVSLPEGVESVHECRAPRMLIVADCRFKSVSIEGFRFLGNSESYSGLLNFEHNDIGRISMSGCSFEGLRSPVVKASQTSNIHISRCTFSHCYRNGIDISNGNNVTIDHNSFDRMGLAMTNSFCIRAAGDKLLISNNELKDFGYGGIAGGTWWATEQTGRVAGAIEYNHLYYTPQYLNNIEAHSLMDSGAIYLYTQNNDMHVCHNYIHDYAGVCHNRGIFCDDGALNFRIYDNLIVNTPNSYSIDARQTLGIEKDARSMTPRVNINNHIYNNIVDGSIRFGGRDKNANCHLGDNVFLSLKGKTRQQNDIVNIQTERNFQRLPFEGISNGMVRVDTTTLRKIKTMGSNRALLKWFEAGAANNR